VHVGDRQMREDSNCGGTRFVHVGDRQMMGDSNRGGTDRLGGEADRPI